MPTVHGSLKSNSLVLQGHGPNSTAGHDVSMNVVNNEFTMKMGNDVLMTVGKDIIDPTTGGTVVTTPHDHDDEYASVDHTHLNFSTDVKFHKNVEIHGALDVNGRVKNTKITSAKTYVDNIFATPMSLWTSAYNKYVANSNSVEEVTLILGNHIAAKLDPSYAKYDPKELKLQFGLIDFTNIHLCEPEKVQVKTLSYQILGDALCALGVNLYMVAQPQAYGFLPQNPMFLDYEGEKESVFASIKLMEQYNTAITAFVTAHKSVISGSLLQGFEFAKSNFQFLNYAYKNDTLNYLRLGVDDTYPSKSPYYFTRGHAHALPNSAFNVIQPSLKKSNLPYDSQKLIIQLSSIPNKIIDSTYLLRNVVSHDYVYGAQNSKSKIGYDQVNTLNTSGNLVGSEALDEVGKPKWIILGQKFLGSTLKSNVSIDSIKTERNKYNSNVLDMITTTGFVGSKGSSLNDFTDEQKSEITKLSYYVKDAMNVRLDLIESKTLNEGITDEYPWEIRNLITKNIVSVDKAKFTITCADGEVIKFNDKRIYEVAKSYEEVCKNYLMCPETLNGIKKIDTNKGYTQGKTRYSSADELYANYAGVGYEVCELTKDIIMGGSHKLSNGNPSGKKPAIECLYDAGVNLLSFFDDLKGYAVNLAWEQGKINTLFPERPVGEKVVDASNYIISRMIPESDWDKVGYHYGMPLTINGYNKNIFPKPYEQHPLYKGLSVAAADAKHAAMLAAYNPSVRSSPVTNEQRSNELDSFQTHYFDQTDTFQYCVREHYTVGSDGKPVIDADGKPKLNLDLYMDPSNHYGATFNSTDTTKNYRNETIKLSDFINLSYYAKHLTHVCACLHETLFYVNGGQQHNMGILPKKYTDYVRNMGSIAQIATSKSSSRSAFGSLSVAHPIYRDEARAVKTFDINMLIAAGGATNFDPTGKDKFWMQSALKPDSPSQGKVRISQGASIPTGDPARYEKGQAMAGVILHESFIGHGFEVMVKEVYEYNKDMADKTDTEYWSWKLYDLTGKPNTLIPINVKYEDFVLSGANLFACVQGALSGEGYGAYSEISTYSSGLYNELDFLNKKIKYDPNVPNIPDAFVVLSGVLSVSRMAARMIGCAKATYPKYMESYPLHSRIFAEQIGSYTRSFISWSHRFYTTRFGGGFQQASYGIGLMGLIQITNELKKKLGNNFAPEKFNMWRGVNGGLLGSALNSTVLKLADEGYFSKT